MLRSCCRRHPIGYEIPGVVKHLLPPCLACLMMWAAGSVLAEPSLRYEVSGLRGQSLDNVRAYLGAEPGSEYERNSFLFTARKRIEESLHALGYYHAEIELQLDKDQPIWQLSISVNPGERVHITTVDVRLEGEAAGDEAFGALLAEIPLAEGGGLNHGEYEDFKDSLLSLGRERGYIDAELRRHEVAVDVDNLEAVIELYYDSGARYRFGAVTFDDFPIRKRLLDQLTTFEEGELFDVSALQSFQADLQSTEYFGSALIQPLASDPETRTIPVHVKLESGKLHHFRAGVGYSTDTQGRISLNWRTPFINRGGHHQNTLAEYSPIRPRLNFTYGIPMSHPLDDTLALGIRVENNRYGSLDSEQQEVSIRREFLLGEWVTSLRLRNLWESWDVGISDRRNHYLLPGVSLAHTYRTGNPVDPDAGFSQWYALEVGEDQAGSDVSLQRIQANWTAVYRLSEIHRLVGRAELGAANFSDNARPDLAPSLSFFAGGSRSIRGYAYQSLGPTERIELPGGITRDLVVGGDRLAILSAEYQHYVTPELRVAVFVDAGNAFNAGDFNPVAGAGLGLHYVSPVGALRLDIANNVSEDNPQWRVHFNIGAEF